MLRLLIVVGLVFHSASAPLLAQDAKPVGPLVTLQTQQLGRILGDIRTVLETIGGKKALATFNEALTERLGEKGLLGLDLTRPILGTLPKLVDAENLSVLLLVPISNEKEFLDLLKRAECDLEPVEKNKGLYTVVLPPQLSMVEKTVLLRVVDKVAYFGLDVTAAEMDAKKLPKAATIEDPKATDTLTIRSFIRNQPKALVEQQEERLQQAEGMLDNLPVPEKFKALVTDLLGGMLQYTKLQNRDGDVQTMRLNLDAKTLELTFAGSLTAKPASALLKSMEAYKPTVSRFAGMASKDAAASLLFRLPLFDETIRKAADIGLDEGLTAAKDQAPEAFHPLLEEFFQGLKRTVKTGRVEVGTAIVPAKSGAYTVDFGLRFADPSKLEKAFRKVAPELPLPKDVLVWDDFSVGAVKVHRIDASTLIPSDFPAIFGKKPVGYLAFAPDAILISFGEDAKERITSNIKAKDAPAPIVEVAANGAKLRKLLEAIPNFPAASLEKFVELDERIVLLNLSVEGGAEFRVSLRTSLRFFLGLAKDAND